MDGHPWSQSCWVAMFTLVTMLYNSAAPEHSFCGISLEWDTCGICFDVALATNTLIHVRQRMWNVLLQIAFNKILPMMPLAFKTWMLILLMWTSTTWYLWCIWAVCQYRAAKIIYLFNFTCITTVLYDIKTRVQTAVLSWVSNDRYVSRALHVAKDRVGLKPEVMSSTRSQ